MLQVARDLFKVSLYLFRGASLSQWPVNNSPYSTIFGTRWFSIMETCPLQQSRVLRSIVSMLVTLAISRTSMLMMKSMQWIFTVWQAFKRLWKCSNHRLGMGSFSVSSSVPSALRKGLLSNKSGHIRLSRLRWIPCSHRCGWNVEFFLRGWAAIRSEYFEACIEECYVQDGSPPSSAGRKLETGELGVLIFSQPAFSAFLDCSHQTNLYFSL